MVLTDESKRMINKIVALFDTVSDPVWVCDPEDLNIHGMNHASIDIFGYGQAQPGEKYLKDVTADLDNQTIAALTNAAHNVSEVLETQWLVQCENGTGLDARVHLRIHEINATRVLVVSLQNIAPRDTDPGFSFKPENLTEALDSTGSFFRSLFEAAPGRFLVLRPRTYQIVAVSDAYLQATLTDRKSITGKSLFEVFPDDPNDPIADGTRSLRVSLSRVETTGITDVMGVLRYPIARPESLGGGFEERFWSPVNTPVKGEGGQVPLIIHRVEDVTDYVKEVGEDTALNALEDRASHLRQDIILRTGELRTAYDRLEEQTAYLRSAKRMLGLGIWKMDLDNQRITWLDDVHRIYGVDSQLKVNDVTGYLQLVHPSDRDSLLNNLKNWLENPDSHFEFKHRIVKNDGEVTFVKGVAELSEVNGQRKLTGVVQDVTEQELNEAAISRGQSLSRIAGKVAKLGGWRVNLNDKVVEWSDETAKIHEVEDGTRHFSLENAIEFYSPEYREAIATLFNRCVEAGEPFDGTLQIITAKGNRRWVRSIGEAELNDRGEIISVQGGFQDITEQVEARHEFEELTQKLHLTLENMRDPFFLLDNQLRFIFLNTAAEKRLHQRRDDLIGKRIDIAFPYEDTVYFETHYQRALDQQESQHFTADFKPLDAYFRVDAHPVPDGLAVYFSDVSREREREEHLRLLEAAVSRQNDMLAITEPGPLDDPDSLKIVYVNNAYISQTGYSKADVIGSPLPLLQQQATDQVALNRIKDALRRNKAIREELINYTKQGEPYWLEIDLVPLTDDRGNTTHIVAVGRNISDRKHMEEATRLSEERFHLVARATNDVIWDWDFKQNSVWWNESMETLFGYNRSTLEKGPESWTNRIHPDDKEFVLTSIHEVIEGQSTNWSEEYRFLHADGRDRTVIDRGFVIRDHEQRAVRMLGSMLDITQERKTAEELRQAQKLEAVGQLTGGVAHDFNNLLTVILGNAELLEEELADSPHLRDLATMAASAASRGAELTNRLLAFARRQALEPQVINVNRLLAGMEHLLRRTLQESIEIELVQAGGLWSPEVDPAQLESAILNLAINARDAMPAGGRLTIETANAMLDDTYADNHQEVKAGQYVLISLSDTGTGMPEDVIRQAFEPFFTTKNESQGSGLGLSMVYGFVKQSGGHIKLYSELEEGTTVKLYFPRSMTGKSATFEAGPSIAVIGGQEHILVVEDDDLVRQHVIALLKGLGYRVSSAESGQMALKILNRRADIDLLFTDVVMPGGLNGRQLADQATALRPGIKILFTSGYTENAIVHHGRLDPGVQLLSKPYRRQDLANKIRRTLMDSE